MVESLSIDGLSFIKRFTSDFSRFSDDYAYVHVEPGSDLRTELFPSVRFADPLLILVRQGCINMTLNEESISLGANAMIMVYPGSILKFNNIDMSTLDAYLMYISKGFMRDINFEINLLNNIPIQVGQTSYITLEEKESELLSKYLELIHFNTVTNNSPSTEKYVRSISRNLMASMLYQMLVLGQMHSKVPEADRHRSRKVTYTHEFMQLVRQHFREQRSVGFYADKLFISPKYLSLVIKEATGRSAATWIDDYVLMEAKNLLRFSGKNIQQVAYELNFTNQSSFGKYFKHLTGMSPSEFQRS